MSRSNSVCLSRFAVGLSFLKCLLLFYKWVEHSGEQRESSRVNSGKKRKRKEKKRNIFEYFFSLVKTMLSGIEFNWLVKKAGLLG